MNHRWSLSEIIGWWWHGISQKIRDLAPLISPSPEWGEPPDWWFWWYTWADWYANLDAHRVPNSLWIQHWTHGVWRVLGYWIEECATWARDEASNRIRAWVGYAQYGFSNFQAWLDNLWKRVAPATRWWYQTITGALDWLFNHLPAEIVQAGLSWSTLFDGIKNTVKAWVVNTYHNLITFGVNAWNWVTDTGRAIKAWWDAAHSVLDSFRANPYAFITSQLGTTWQRLTAFATNALNYYMNLWAQHATTLADFLADPGGHVWAWLENQWIKLW